ncbi:phosphotransferase enzyme family protein [Occultella kanbiaonis]|uniref:phosphotransferase enzyme family protein n=1 Tax=Occultella kanbiaonis TaxID=2675754 RepID=UPI0013D17B0E|nr:phosphotransferase [Occultella kanbiaonis]
MTKSGSFKRAVRDHARRTGQRYTQARADLEDISRPFADTRPFDPDALTVHLESRYGIRITSMLPIDDDPRTRPRGSWPGHYPSTLLVEREQGTPWIARVFSSPADRVSRVQEDAEILGFLADHGFPAERPAVDDAVTVFDGSGVLLTELIAGGRPTDAHGRVTSPEVLHELASLLGRLHSLPPVGGAAARDGGSEEHDGGFHVGRPRQDLVAAMRFLVSVEDRVAPAGRETFERLRDDVESADDAEGLPEAFTHGNFHAWAAVGVPGELSIVGWAGSGRGPRLPALAWLLRTTSEGRPEFVDAVMRGYREHVSLTDEEVDRLPAVLNIRPLWLACLEYREAVRAGQTPLLDDDGGYGFHRPERSEHLAAQAVAALSDPPPRSTEP